MGRAVAIALAALAFAGFDADRRAASHCAVPAGAHVLRRTHEAVVFVPRHHGVYGCASRTGHRWRLADSPRYWLTGRFAAYRLWRIDPDGGEFFLLVVRDLRNGHARYRAIYKESARDDGETPGAIADLVLKRDGAVAWIACHPQTPDLVRCFPPDRKLPYQVWRFDRRGTPKLDSSSGIRVHSLTLSGSSISWRHGSGVRHATLR